MRNVQLRIDKKMKKFTKSLLVSIEASTIMDKLCNLRSSDSRSAT